MKREKHTSVNEDGRESELIMSTDHQIAEIEIELALKILRIYLEKKESWSDWTISEFHLRIIEAHLSSGLNLLTAKEK